MTKYERTTTSRLAAFTFALVCIALAGCDSLRFAPNEAQKRNAWLHNRTAIVAAETARAEETSEKLQALTQLGEVQSGRRLLRAAEGIPASRDCRGHSCRIELAACPDGLAGWS